jgi:pSer/pThr/pTyr-binding forkhead associated (FHA) protein
MEGFTCLIRMQNPQNEVAAWADLDWGQMAPKPLAEVNSQTNDEVSVMTSLAKSKRIESGKPGSDQTTVEPSFEPPRAAISEKRIEVDLAGMNVGLFRQPELQVESPDKLRGKRNLELRGPGFSASKNPAQESARVVMPASLATLVFSSEGEGDEAVTVKDQTTVGRNKENEVVIEDVHVSGCHAKFVSRKDGILEVLDLNSSSGTYVNGAAVQRMDLATGDRLKFGTVTAIFKYVAGPQLNEKIEFEGTLVQGKRGAAKKLANLKKSKKEGVLFVLSHHTDNPTVHVTTDVTVGRGPGNSLVLSEEHVSTNHARLVCSGGGMVEVIDLGSMCGTFVNGVPVKEKLLASGDKIRFGVVECVFRVVETDAVASRNEGAPLKKVEDAGIKKARPAQAQQGANWDIPEPKPATPAARQAPLLKRSDK